MNTKKAIPLVAAILLGTMASIMVVRVLSNRQSISIVRGPSLPKVVTVKHEIGAGEKLTDDDLSLDELSVSSTPDGTFSDPSLVAGRVALTPMLGGQAVQESMLAAPGSPDGLQAVIPPGMRAVTVQIDEISGVAGYIVPGAHVDILQTLHDNVNNEDLGRAIIQNVEVTAVGQRHVGPDDQGQASRSVTLLATPHQAAIIELASMKGRPRLILRGAGDDRIEETAPATLTELNGVSHTEPAMPVIYPETRPSGDPFAEATTRPADGWTIQVVTGGEPSMVKLKFPQQSDDEPHESLLERLKHQTVAAPAPSANDAESDTMDPGDQ